jgi:hypothetical protein
MASSDETKESKTTEKDYDCSRNIWSTVHATYDMLVHLTRKLWLIYVSKTITSSPEMINIVNTKPGSNGKPFHASVHKDLLCYYSPYYTAALKGGFSEAKRDTITMELPYDLMADLISWLYSGTMISRGKTNLMDLYVFADEKMMLAFRRSIMSRLIECHDPENIIAVEDAIPYIKRLPQHSGLFRYFVDYWAYIWGQGDTKLGMATFDVDKRIPREFFYQVVDKLGSITKRNNATAGTTTLNSACYYHEHVDRSELSKSMFPPYPHSLTTVLVLTRVACGNVVSRPDLQSVSLPTR